MTALNGVEMRLLKMNFRIDEAEVWLESPHSKLGGLTPRQVIKVGGVESVHEVLDHTANKPKQT